MRKGDSIRQRWDKGEEVTVGEMASLKAGNALTGCIATPIATVASFLMGITFAQVLGMFGLIVGMIIPWVVFVMVVGKMKSQGGPGFGKNS